MVMQLAVAGDSSFCGTGSPGGITNADVGLLWPSNSSDDVIRRHLTAILLEDPDHRLRVAHLEPLLHLRMASQHACSSGRLQALLTDPATARIFPVDFSNTRASDWRSRVVYLDLPQLLKEAAAVKQQQQQLGSATAAAGDMHDMYADSSGSVLQAGSEAPCGRLPSDAAAAANMPSPQHHHSMHSQGQLMLESIFGASPALGRVSDAAEASQRRTSGSMGGTAGGSYGTAGSMGGEPRSSGGLSGIDVCTPKSAGVGVVSGDASASPVHSSSAAEEDVEYSEAQLVFGVTGSGSVPNGNGVSRMSAGGSAALSSATAAAAEAAAADAEYLSQAAAAAAAAQCGMSGRDGPPVEEVQGLVGQFNGVLKAEDFDEGVVHQLNAKRSEEEAVAAVRHIAHYDLANIQHMAAYLNHLVKHYNHGAAAAAAAAAADGAAALGHAAAGLNGAVRTGSAGGISAGGGGQLQACSLGSTLGSSRGGSGAGGVPGSAAAAAAAGGNLGAFGGQIRLASVPVSTKSMLQKLPLKVFRQLEALVASCAYLEWRHFDAGVVKVLAQLSKLCEADVFEELELLAATDLSNVEYMPAYLNKRLNNKLWSRRKADGHVPSG
ncbi:hypothetical protein OEZ85_007916 [Tetradesmus obliquus]|uniref:Protein kinase domain-containing protein n=1 Tax=Tetradesmus obliquus TaxID=3088 RepID=A0ABY8THM5_TETOB|nr:hypothetical protein OEZ85_007916 [Tetradesmus obliquus]